MVSTTYPQVYKVVVKSITCVIFVRWYVSEYAREQNPGSVNGEWKVKMDLYVLGIMLPVAGLSGFQQGPPLFLEAAAAGFPSPAEDYIECRLDLNEHLIRHPSATFFVRVAGDSMTGAGIHDGDILIVDRSLEPESGSVVVAAVNGELTVKRLLRRNGRSMLKPENDAFSCVDIPEQADVHIWGVATSVIHTL